MVGTGFLHPVVDGMELRRKALCDVYLFIPPNKFGQGMVDLGMEAIDRKFVDRVGCVMHS